MINAMKEIEDWMSGMLRGVQSEFCTQVPEHQQLYKIAFICMEPGCQHRLICQKCMVVKDAHIMNHRHSIRPIADVKDMLESRCKDHFSTDIKLIAADVTAKYEKKVHGACKICKETVISTMDRVFPEMSETIIQNFRSRIGQPVEQISARIHANIESHASKFLRGPEPAENYAQTVTQSLDHALQFIGHKAKEEKDLWDSAGRILQRQKHQVLYNKELDQRLKDDMERLTQNYIRDMLETYQSYFLETEKAGERRRLQASHGPGWNEGQASMCELNLTQIENRFETDQSNNQSVVDLLQQENMSKTNHLTRQTHHTNENPSTSGVFDTKQSHGVRVESPNGLVKNFKFQNNRESTETNGEGEKGSHLCSHGKEINEKYSSPSNQSTRTRKLTENASNTKEFNLRPKKVRDFRSDDGEQGCEFLEDLGLQNVSPTQDPLFKTPPGKYGEAHPRETDWNPENQSDLQNTVRRSKHSVTFSEMAGIKSLVKQSSLSKAKLSENVFDRWTTNDECQFARMFEEDTKHFDFQAMLAEAEWPRFLRTVYELYYPGLFYIFLEYQSLSLSYPGVSWMDINSLVQGAGLVNARFSQQQADELYQRVRLATRAVPFKDSEIRRQNSVDKGLSRSGFMSFVAQAALCHFYKPSQERPFEEQLKEGLESFMSAFMNYAVNARADYDEYRNEQIQTEEVNESLKPFMQHIDRVFDETKAADGLLHLPSLVSWLDSTDLILNERDVQRCFCLSKMPLLDEECDNGNSNS
jgi:hypothetical protein